MAKTLIIDAEGTRTPFLRGILTRSLHDAGMPFDQAYKLASRVRHELSELEEITTVDLRARVLAILRETEGCEVCDAYEASARTPATIMVRDNEGQVVPFSRSQHYLCLESCGLSNENAAAATARVYEHLLQEGVSEISSGRIGHLTYCCLAKMFGREAAHRYMVWVDYLHSGRPLILLIGGTTGSGKSTIATEMAHRLGIVRTQSTDMLREVMRMLVPQRLLPVLHTSSFDAWQALPEQLRTDSPNELANGYRSQAELLSLPCEAVVHRALRERVSLILEGVHVQPSLFERFKKHEDAIIVPIMLAVLKQKHLRKRLKGRGVVAPLREASYQLSYFEGIWSLQEYLLSEADRLNVPIIANEDKYQAVELALHTVIDALSESFSGTPKGVFV